jgi:tetratricopeptide (TPR) repeat protein
MSRFHNLEFNEESREDQKHSSSTPSPAPRDEAYYQTQARFAFESGAFEEALRHYAKVLEYNPESASAWTGQVRMLIELGQFDEAKRWADKALERFPNEPELLAAKGVALARLGDLEGALAYSDASIEESGESPYLWLARGDVQLARKEERAAYCFDKAMAVSARDWVARWLAARIHHYYKKFAQALKWIQEALSLNPGHGVLWLQLGLCQQQLGLLGPARTSFVQAREFSVDREEADAALRQLLHSSWLTRLKCKVSRFLRS